MDTELMELLKELVKLEGSVAIEQLAELKMERSKHMRHVEMLDDRIKLREDIGTVFNKILGLIDVTKGGGLVCL